MESGHEGKNVKQNKCFICDKGFQKTEIVLKKHVESVQCFLSDSVMLLLLSPEVSCSKSGGAGGACQLEQGLATQVLYL